MKCEIDFLFKAKAGYDELVELIQSNPRYVFKVTGRDKIDKRTSRSKVDGWVEVRHKQHRGVIRLSKNNGVCRAGVTDESGGLKLIGAWTSWLASNASDLIAGLYPVRVMYVGGQTPRTVATAELSAAPDWGRRVRFWDFVRTRCGPGR